MNKTTLNKFVLADIVLVFCLIALTAAAFLGVFHSPPYTYTAAVEGVVQNSLDDATWNTSALSGTGSNAHFYCRFLTTNVGHSDSVTITWQLQYKNITWQNVAGAVITSSVTMTGAAGQEIYATANGEAAGNEDWASYFGSSGQYQVEANFNN